MKKSKFLFVRILRYVTFSVFCVDKDQKNYWDKNFNTKLPYSSGQQVKHSIMDSILDVLNLKRLGVTFNFGVDGNKLTQKEVTQPCDPTYYDQLLGGWMSISSKKGDTGDDVENKKGMNLKRRSPLSISAMTPVHPLLASLIHEKNMTFDRTETKSDDEFVVRDKNKNIMSEDDLKSFLEKSNSDLTKRKFIDGKDRANGFFDVDVAIDLEKLFRIPLLLNDIEIDETIEKKLRESNWVEVEIDGIKYLELPKDEHDKVADAIAWGIINWQITSNQSRTFDTMPVLSVAISNRPDEISSAIRGEISEDNENKADLVVDTNYPNTKIFSTKLLNGYVSGVETSYTAIDDAVSEIKKTILEYYS